MTNILNKPLSEGLFLQLLLNNYQYTVLLFIFLWLSDVSALFIVRLWTLLLVQVRKYHHFLLGSRISHQNEQRNKTMHVFGLELLG